MPKAINFDRLAETIAGQDGSVKAVIQELGLEATGANDGDAKAALQRKFVEYIKDRSNAETVQAFFDKHGEEGPIPGADPARSSEISAAALKAEEEFHPLTEETFDRWIHERTVLIDFTAEWCGPCKLMAPTLRDLSKELGMPVGRVDADASKGLVERFKVKGYPTVLLLKDGEEKNRVVGAHPDPVELGEILRDAFQEWAV
ncbi:MAG TPA: thioredoxin family protein [Actinomycetota bacterium]|nr:thioredoxin family protein [Actinomycetota bacterium]